MEAAKTAESAVAGALRAALSAEEPVRAWRESIYGPLWTPW